MMAWMWKVTIEDSSKRFYSTKHPDTPTPKMTFYSTEQLEMYHDWDIKDMEVTTIGFEVPW